MTTTISTEARKEVISYLQREFLSALQKTLTPESGGGPLAAEPIELSGPWQGFYCMSQSFEPAQFGSVLLGAKPQKAFPKIQELFAGLGSTLANSFSTRLKQDVRCGALSEQPAPGAADQCIAIKLTIGDAPAYFAIFPSPELIETLVIQDAEKQESERETSTAVVSVNATAARNLDLLLDVEMPVSISFGRTQLALKDVFKLTIGSMVELNRAISEPVDVIVNNSVIARGEVVVVEGDFGVRITQVMSKHDRIRSLT